MNGDPYKQIVYSPLATPKLKGRAVPREFYDDIERSGEKPTTGELCLNRFTFWDGEDVCRRPKGHRVDSLNGTSVKEGEFHQEPHEGWIWDNEGNVF